MGLIAKCTCGKCLALREKTDAGSRRFDWTLWNQKHQGQHQPTHAAPPKAAPAPKVKAFVPAPKPIAPKVIAPKPVVPKVAKPPKAQMPKPVPKVPPKPVVKPPVPKPVPVAAKPSAKSSAPSAPAMKPEVKQAKQNLVLKAMPKAERQALDQGFASAQKEGFRGTLNNFLEQQVELYKTAQEGDPRIKTWFGTGTHELLKANGLPDLTPAGAAHAERAMSAVCYCRKCAELRATVDNRTAKRTNPLGVKAPKGSAQAPLKSMGAIKVLPSQTASVTGGNVAPAATST